MLSIDLFGGRLHLKKINNLVSKIIGSKLIIGITKVIIGSCATGNFDDTDEIIQGRGFNEQDNN